MFNKSFFSTPITSILSMKLRNCYMRFINHTEKIIRKIIKQGIRRVTMLAPINVHRIIFNSTAESNLAHHFKIMFCSHAKPLRFKQLIICSKLLQLQLQFFFDPTNSPLKTFSASSVMGCRKNDDFIYFGNLFSCQRINKSNPVYRIPEKFYSYHILFISRMDFN